MLRVSMICVIVPMFLMASEGNARVWHVPQEVPTIQIAISKADTGDRIIVGQGTYIETIDYGGKMLTIQSTDPLDRGVVEATIIDANGLGTVVRNLGHGASINGFTITGGDVGIDANSTRADVLNCIVRDCTSYGIYGVDGDIINTASLRNSYGIMFCNGYKSRCLLEENGGGARSSAGVFEDCVITGSTSASFGVGVSYCNDAEFIRCSVTRNRCSGFSASYNLSVRQSVIVGNGSHGLLSNTGAIENSIVAGNKQSGMMASTMDVLSCSVTGNLNFGFAQHSGLIEHCIIWDNGDGPTNDFSSTPLFSSTFDPYFLQPGSWDNGNWQDGDYHLVADSPVIDLGDPSYGSIPSVDLDGNPRIVGERVDIGAYEFQRPCSGPDFDGDGMADLCDPDTDNDGISNTLDPCDFTPKHLLIDLTGRPRGDQDWDCRVTLRDYAIMQTSMMGP